ncbi:hypothetical protein RM611_11000 [Staphylococcus chromogenes]|uniref:hypothetical protein n=1 Tax=Staphylococcus chromogenes TaxID=46126 RepID=UPI0028855A08|nr:hypothetical protein [Staphylococcus chromogenes]MDT0694116.1 hypothetical protein [Staphylococcus chromogenes]
MSNVAIFNQHFFALLVFYLISLLMYFIYKGNTLDFFSFNLKYTTIRRVIKETLRTVIFILITSLLFIEWYNILGTSNFQIKDYKEDPLINIFVIIAANVSVIMILASLKIAINFFKTITYYIILKKHNVPNNLRRAIHKKDFDEIITYFKLYTKSNESISLYKDEALILSACLTKAGLIKDLDKLLENQLYKPVSLLNGVLLSAINSIEYKLQTDNNNLIYSDSLTHELIQHNRLFKFIYVFLLLIGIIQFCFVISQLFIPINTVTRISVILMAIFIVGGILFKYKHLLKIYKSHTDNAMLNVSNEDNIVIKKSNSDKVILLAQIVFIITMVVGPLFP